MLNKWMNEWTYLNLDHFPLNTYVVLNPSAVLIQKTDAIYSKSSHKWLKTDPRTLNTDVCRTTVMVFCNVLLSTVLCYSVRIVTFTWKAMSKCCSNCDSRLAWTKTNTLLMTPHTQSRPIYQLHQILDWLIPNMWPTTYYRETGHFPLRGQASCATMMVQERYQRIKPPKNGEKRLWRTRSLQTATLQAGQLL